MWEHQASHREVARPCEPVWFLHLCLGVFRGEVSAAGACYICGQVRELHGTWPGPLKMGWTWMRMVELGGAGGGSVWCGWEQGESTWSNQAQKLVLTQGGQVSPSVAQTACTRVTWKAHQKCSFLGHPDLVYQLCCGGPRTLFDAPR